MVQRARLHASFVDQTTDALFTTDLRGRLSYVNAAAARLLHCSAEEAPGVAALDVVAECYRDEAREFFTRQIVRRIAQTYYELPIAGRHGELHWLALHVSLRTSAGGTRVGGLQVIARDLGDRRAAQEAVRRSEERFRQLFDENLAAIFIASPEGLLRACNPAFVRLFGFTSIADAIGADLNTLYPEDVLAARFAQVRAEGAVHEEEAEVRRVDGRALHVIQSFVGRLDERGALAAVTGYVLDDTPRKTLQVQVRQAMRMEAVGRLAGGIAHDFNNLLMIIIGLSEALLEQMAEDDPLRAEADQILEAGRRGSTLASQILAFSRKPIPHPSRFDVEQVLAGMKPMIARLLGSTITLEVTHAPGPKWISADREQLEQVLLNLVTNAHDAMPDGGRLTLHTSTTTRGPEVERGASATPRVLISLRDTGIGMAPETQARIFEPFFTTKARGKGTGLGLAQVDAILTENGSYIDVKSAVGVGTTFVLSLPLVPAPESHASDGHTADGGSARAMLDADVETVLVVDDEAPVRVLISDSLRRLGYRVIAAEHAEAALAVVREHGDALRLLITDVVMPGRSGRELAREVEALLPQLPVMFMSGYPERVLGLDAAAPAAFLQKPFALDVLALRVRQMLDRAASAVERA